MYTGISQSQRMDKIRSDICGPIYLEALALEERPKVVELDRPFVMGIYDNETQSFLFLGVINQVGD